MKSYINPLACRVAALFTLMMIICPLSVSADEVLDEGGSKWYFTRENNVTKLHHYSGEVTENVTTPATVYYQGVGYPVTAIGGTVFRSNMPTTLKYLTISEGVTSIEDWAFTNCTALVSASLPSSLRSIGALAFFDCTSLASIAIPDGVEVISELAFSSCTSLASVTIPASVTTIGERAFSGCSALTSITIPNSVTAIGDLAFDSSGLKSVYFAGTRNEWRAVSKGTRSFNINGVNHDNYVEEVSFFHWRCTLTFDVQGHGTAPASQTLWSNSDVIWPANPEATGYEFGGWYWFPDDTGDPVVSDLQLYYDYTVYAKWIPLPNTITFNLGGKGTAIPGQTVYSGDKVTEPAVQFVGNTGSEEGIEGWYTNAELTDPYDFAAEVNHSFTLYAKWAAAGHYTLAANAGGTVTLTDTKGHAYDATGPIMPGTYTLTVTPQSGYSFTGSYVLTNRSNPMNDPDYSIAGSSTKTYTLDLTQKDAAISVSFSTSPILTISVTTDGTAAEGSYSLCDGNHKEYFNGSTVTLPVVGGISSGKDNITLTVTKGATVGCAATIVNNGKKTQITNDVTNYDFGPQGNIDIELFFYDKTSGMVTLLDDDRAQGEGHRNADLLGAANGQKRMVTLSGRTLYRDGNWNTLCLPFDLDIEGSALNKTGMTLMELDTEAGSYTNATGFDDGTLYLNFRDAGTTIHAGKPYIIKWKSSNSNISEPVFGPVTITTGISAVESTDGTLSFTGLYSPVNIAGEDRSILFLGEDNNLYYPNAATTIKPFRAYFKLGDGASNVSTMRLGFGDGSATAVRPPFMENGEGSMDNDADAWYDLAGRRLTDRPATPGIYIHSGKKIVIK